MLGGIFFFVKRKLNPKSILSIQQSSPQAYKKKSAACSHNKELTLQWIPPPKFVHGTDFKFNTRLLSHEGNRFF